MTSYLAWPPFFPLRFAPGERRTGQALSSFRGMFSESWSSQLRIISTETLYKKGRSHKKWLAKNHSFAEEGECRLV